ncbi:DUF418 domain-containing protein [Gilvimarinus chinensis]|uniref:DUF418 domain-containing protein n=1 Tax=Gilvimarinus chinensis TaxID=396005 RepID=UPI000381A9B1|nr:DUF418 domain-containing protein [Gilvimarinus chinensis]
MSANKPRIETLDSLRGAAVLGILLLNIVSFSLPRAYSDPSIYGGAEGWNLAAFAVTHLFFEGTMRGLFSLLFGASILLLSGYWQGANQSSQTGDLYYRRMLWLFIFGLVHAWGLLWFGDVLYWYALAGMFAYPMRVLRARWLMIIGLALLATLVPRTADKVQDTINTQQTVQIATQKERQNQALTQTEQEALAHWEDIQRWRKPDDAELARQIDALQGNYVSVFSELKPTIIAYQSTIVYQGGLFDALGMMLIGMALFKTGVLTAQRSTRFYASLALGGIGIGATVNALELAALIRHDFSLLAVLKWSFLGLYYDVGRVPLTLGYVGLFLWLAKTARLTRVRQALAVCGRMALTLYVSQSALGAFIFYGFGLGWYGQLERAELYLVVAGIWTLQILTAHWWLTRYKFGPLEWLWRSLVYWQPQPMAQQLRYPQQTASHR